MLSFKYDNKMHWIDLASKPRAHPSDNSASSDSCRQEAAQVLLLAACVNPLLICRIQLAGEVSRLEAEAVAQEVKSPPGKLTFPHSLKDMFLVTSSISFAQAR